MAYKPNQLLLIFTCTLFSAVSVYAASIKGTLKTSPQVKKIYLFVFQGDILSPFDSCKLKGNNFTFIAKGKSFPNGIYKLGISSEKSTTLVLSKEDITVELNDKNWEDSKISNSPENEKYGKYKVLNKRVSFEMRVLEGKYRTLTPLAQTDKPAFEGGVKKLQEKADSLMKDQQLKLIGLQAESKDLYVSKFLRLTSIDQNASPETFITPQDWEDEENLRANVWETRVSNYFQKFGQGDADKWIILGDQVIKQTKEKSPAREIALRSVAKALKPLEESGLNAAYEVAKRYSNEFPGKRSTEFLNQFPAGPPSVGEMAPDIELADRDGKMLKMSSLRGKVVLLDFWASWCGPCRHENPTVVRAYQKFESKGFTVFSVSLDQSKEKWLSAIVKDGLVWNNHVSDLKGWASGGAALYQVKGIPATFLLDKDGKIAAKNLRGQALEDKLKELLGPE